MPQGNGEDRTEKRKKHRRECGRRKPTGLETGEPLPFNGKTAGGIDRKNIAEYNKKRLLCVKHLRV